ncbi:MAG: carboxypeptidase-like regulatory domain-containing protein, partial [Planctomycetota bacterium]
LTVSVFLEPIAMVSGRVLYANGRPVRGAMISLQRAGEAVLESRESGYSDGRFRFPEVLPGRYRIVARSDDREASVEIEVTGTEAEEVELQF